MTRPRLPVVRAALVTLCVLLAAGCSFLGGHKVNMPKNAPANTLVTFYLAPSGDSDARYYGAGLTAALGQTLGAARPPIVYQASPYGDDGPLRNAGPKQLSQAEAIKAVRTMGARYGLTGFFRLGGDEVLVTLWVIDATRPSWRKQINATGKLADLSSLEPALTRQVIAAMGLKPSDEQSKALNRAGFTKPKTLMLIGKALLTKDLKQSLAIMSQAWKVEPTSLLATYHTLAVSSDPDFTYTDMAGNKALPQVINSAMKYFANEPIIKESMAWLSIRKYQYATAEVILDPVLRDYRDAIMPHSLHSYAAIARHNGDEAVEEAERLVDLWPSSSAMHAQLAQAYARRAADARNRHSVSQLSGAVRKRWQADSKAAFDEASAAVKVDRNCVRAWHVIMAVSMDMGKNDQAMSAFRQIVRLEPAKPRTYQAFLAGSMGAEGSEQNLDAVLALADRNLSVRDAYVVRGMSILADSPGRNGLIHALTMAGKALKLSDDFDSDTFELACRSAVGLNQTVGALALAKLGFGEDPSPKWRSLLASAYMMQWRQVRDQQALGKAADLMAGYVLEIPGESYGHSLYGYCLLEQDKRDQARTELSRALELDPNDQNAAYWLKRMR